MEKNEENISKLENIAHKIDAILCDTSSYERDPITDCYLRRLQFKGAVYAEGLLVTDNKIDEDSVKMLRDYSVFCKTDEFNITTGYVISKAIMKMFKHSWAFDPEMSAIVFNVNI